MKGKKQISPNLKFRRPHEKHINIFCEISVDPCANDCKGIANIPKSNTVAFGGLVGQKSFRSVAFLNILFSQ